MEARDEPVSIEAIATEAGLTTFHFIRRFTAVFGETPHQYRMRARLEHAKHLLILDERSVTEICFELGFSSLGSFSSRFTRDVGRSPSSYRRQHRATGAKTLPHSVAPGCLNLLAELVR